MTLVAVTDINHGKDDGERVLIEAGQPVKGLPKDVVEHLVAIGSATEEVLPEGTQERISELEDEVAYLRAQLGEQSHKQNVSQVVFEANGGLELEADGELEVDDEADKATKAPAKPEAGETA
jgi:hypothetical protein